MATSIVIVNKSQNVSATQAQLIAKAIQSYLQDDVGPAWASVLGANAMPVTVDAMPEAPVPSVAWPIYLVDEDPTPDALGYHEDDAGDGSAPAIPSAYVNVGEILQFNGFVMNSDGPGSPSVSSVVAHEAAEMLCDSTADQWLAMPDGRQTIREVCDWVQALSYPKKLDDGSQVDVSDFVLPAGFVALGSPSPSPMPAFDFLKVLAAPFTLSPGGYMSVQDGDGNISQVEGERPVGHVQKVRMDPKAPPVGYWELRRSKKWSRSNKVARRAKKV